MAYLINDIIQSIARLSNKQLTPSLDMLHRPINTYLCKPVINAFFGTICVNCIRYRAAAGRV